MKLLFMLMMSVCMLGCSSLPTWLGGNASVPSEVAPAAKTLTKFSDSPQMAAPANREYRKMTRARMEEESELFAHAGSTWVMEGQSAYLFTQNKSRKEGDALKVRLEGMAQKQVDTKVSVIKKLLKQLEEEENKQKEVPLKTASAAEAKTADNKPQDRAPASKEKDEATEALSLEAVTTKITERTADGNYRVKGSEPFMIGKREYKVIITGLIRPEDFNDEGISSNKLIDPQYEVVSIRRSQQ
jgi:flagellar L-ring protein precursor FlgH